MVAEVLARQQSLALEEDDLYEALRLGEALWDICESHFGPMAPQTVQAMLDLRRGAWLEAPALLWRAHEIYKFTGESEGQIATLTLFQTVMANLASQASISGAVAHF